MENSFSFIRCCSLCLFSFRILFSLCFFFAQSRLLVQYESSHFKCGKYIKFHTRILYSQQMLSRLEKSNNMHNILLFFSYLFLVKSNIHFIVLEMNPGQFFFIELMHLKLFLFLSDYSIEVVLSQDSWLLSNYHVKILYFKFFFIMIGPSVLAFNFHFKWKLLKKQINC